MTRNNDDSRRLLVLAFDTRVAAQEAWSAARRLVEGGKVELDGAVLVHKDRDGVTSIEPIDGAAPGAPRQLLGALVAALVAGPDGEVSGGDAAVASAVACRLVDIGVVDTAIEEVRCLVDPGNSALALLARPAAAEATLAELRRFAGSRVVAARLDARWAEHVGEVLARRATPAAGPAARP
jgi:uncharacterized membrane protein